MNKMLVAVFDSETQAFEGLSALKDLHNDGDVSVYSTAVLEKNDAGEVSVKQAAEQGAAGLPIGMLAGGFIGLLAGPVGMAIGASLGGLTGFIVDLNRSGVDVDFLDDVSKALTPGKFAVLADIQEGWTTPVDSRLAEHGALVFRRLRAEVEEEQLARESAQFKAEMDELKDELKAANDDMKGKIQADIDTVKEKLTAMHDVAQTRLDATRSEADAKLTALHAQIKDAGERKKSKIEKRIEEAKAAFASKQQKLENAVQAAKDALADD